MHLLKESEGDCVFKIQSLKFYLLAKMFIGSSSITHYRETKKIFFSLVDVHPFYQYILLTHIASIREFTLCCL